MKNDAGKFIDYFSFEIENKKRRCSLQKNE
jgi:hypothetical protein